MPYRSRKQLAFAFATKQPWAKRWADETPNIKNLPIKVLEKRRKNKRG